MPLTILENPQPEIVTHGMDNCQQGYNMMDVSQYNLYRLASVIFSSDGRFAGFSHLMTVNSFR